MSIEIRQPDTDDEFRRYFHLRWKLLRAPWKQAEGSETDDIEDQCFHLMAIDKSSDTVIAVARLQSNSSDEAQIRYMAVEDDYRRRGIGRRMIETMERYARQGQNTTIILDAREPALDFYRALGYSIQHSSYLLFDEIQHYRMSKQL